MTPRTRPEGSGDSATGSALVRMRLEGLLCASCAATAAAVLRRVRGVLWAEVSIVTGEAAVAYDPARTSPESLAHAVEAGGFGVATLNGAARTAR